MLTAKSIRRRLSVFVPAAIMAVSGCVQAWAEPGVSYAATVIRVADGDTVTVEFPGERGSYNRKERIRFCGIDTPELNTRKSLPPEPGAREAKDYLCTRLLGRTVQIEPDDVSAFRDRYGRAVAYVWCDGELINTEMIALGYARYYDKFKFSPSRMTYFRLLQTEAKAKGRGIWKKRIDRVGIISIRPMQGVRKASTSKYGMKAEA